MGLGYKCRAKRGGHQRRNNDSTNAIGTAPSSPALLASPASGVAIRPYITSLGSSIDERATRYRAYEGTHLPRRETITDINVMGVLEVAEYKKGGNVVGVELSAICLAECETPTERETLAFVYKAAFDYEDVDDTALQGYYAEEETPEYIQRFHALPRKEKRKLARQLGIPYSFTKSSPARGNSRSRKRLPYLSLTVMVSVAVLVLLLAGYAMSR